MKPCMVITRMVGCPSFEIDVRADRTFVAGHMLIDDRDRIFSGVAVERFDGRKIEAGDRVERGELVRVRGYNDYGDRARFKVEIIGEPIVDAST